MVYGVSSGIQGCSVASAAKLTEYKLRQMVLHAGYVRNVLKDCSLKLGQVKYFKSLCYIC